MQENMLGGMLGRLRAAGPVVHCVTNYVTANVCANALLACGAQPMMSDAPEEARDVALASDAVVLNLGTLNAESAAAMDAAAAAAHECGCPVVLDPVGVGISAFRRDAARRLLESGCIDAVCGNASEILLLAGSAAGARGTAAAAQDCVTFGDRARACELAAGFARQAGVSVCVSGAIDVVSDGKRACCAHNGDPQMARMTGAGCMLSAVTAAFLAANPGDAFMAMVAAVCMLGCAGEQAAALMQAGDGPAMFGVRLVDALSNMDAPTLCKEARYECM